MRYSCSIKRGVHQSCDKVLDFVMFTTSIFRSVRLWKHLLVVFPNTGHASVFMQQCFKIAVVHSSEQFSPGLLSPLSSKPANLRHGPYGNTSLHTWLASIRTNASLTCQTMTLDLPLTRLVREGACQTPGKF